MRLAVLPPVLAVLTQWVHCQQSTPATLAEIRHQLVGQKVVVKNASGYAHLLGWHYAELNKAGHYNVHSTKFIDSKYIGKEAVVVAVQLDARTARGRHANALGEVVNDDAIENPDVDVFVRFEDGKLATVSTDSFLLDRYVILVRGRDRHAALMSTSLRSVVGRQLYACADSRLYPVSTSLSELVAAVDSYSTLETKRVRDVPLLQPLTILEAKFFPEHDAIVKKLRLSDGRDVLTIDRYRDSDDKPILDENFTYNDESFLQKASGSSLLITSIPSVLDSHDIAAVQNRQILTGMSRRALRCGYGTPDKVNDWGSGGRQLVYYGGRLLVYLDADGRVSDRQALNF
jgi:hypothetical protein